MKAYLAIPTTSGGFFFSSWLAMMILGYRRARPGPRHHRLPQGYANHHRSVAGRSATSRGCRQGKAVARLLGRRLGLSLSGSRRLLIFLLAASKREPAAEKAGSAFRGD